MSSPYRVDSPIVVGVDDTEAAMRAVRWAAITAVKHRAPLRLVHASGFTDPYLIGFTVPPPEMFREDLQERQRQALRTAEDIASRLDVPSVEATFVSDAAIPYLLHASHQARMVVVGSSGRTGLAGLMVGSTTLALVSHAHSPVVSVRRDYPDAVADDRRPVVVGVDGSPLSERAVTHAFAEASRRGVALVAVHTWSDTSTAMLEERRLLTDWEPIHEYETRVLAERLAGWQEEYPDVHVERHVVKDRPRHELIERSREAQLVVVGSRGRGGFRGMLLGSTSQALIHHAACPVMIVRPDKHAGSERAE
ncbi:universal stress protein [Saccharomonospora sp. NB11]|jgi:nucleotide-binding universal stress UspA family protein|uniref:universal stress protein n=1 Tax=Saccharomonospora sp. NB11 TaxID=1642298 RepID=UPI0018D0411E|nr:universal stress protein [Saccharomonospora sp. NB11]